jgi:soluble lytic murein transglycosylase-like protein
VAELGASTGLSNAPPGRRMFVRLILMLGCLVLLWTVAEKAVLAPLLEGVRNRGGYARVAGHRAAIVAGAAESGIDPYLIAGIVFAESSGRVNAKSGAGANGLMQLMMPTAVEQAQKLGLETPTETDLLTNPELNIRLGSNYFAWVMKHEGQHVERSLVAYNAGRGRLGKWIAAAGSYEEWRAERMEAGKSSTLTYASRVLAAREEFIERGLFAPEPVAP